MRITSSLNIMDLFTASIWSPYLAGAGIGVLLWIAFLFSGRPIGCSTAFSRTAGMIQCCIFGNDTKDSEYYQMVQPKIEWQWMLVLGIVIGAFISSMASSTFQVTIVPDMFAASFGNDPIFRLIIALIGGIFMGLGARWAWGCTSGHQEISGKRDFGLPERRANTPLAHLNG